MFKEKSLFNKIWYKFFKRRLVYKKGVIWNRDERMQYECTGCKKRHWDIPNMSGEKYQWSWDDKISCQLQPKFEEDDLKIYGWIIEMKWIKYEGKNWEIYWNKRVYHSKEVAFEAINQISSTGWFNDYEFRVRPLYDVSTQYYRNIKISKLLKEKK
jgi:hypothetical protein